MNKKLTKEQDRDTENIIQEHVDNMNKKLTQEEDQINDNWNKLFKDISNFQETLRNF